MIPLFCTSHWGHNYIKNPQLLYLFVLLSLKLHFMTNFQAFTGGVTSPQLPLCVLFRAQTVTKVEPPMFY